MSDPRMKFGELDGFIPVRALELEAGDVIRVADRLARVVSDPETIHRGLSPFDEFQLLVGLRVTPLQGAPSQTYLVFEPEELVPATRGDQAWGTGSGE